MRLLHLIHHFFLPNRVRDRIRYYDSHEITINTRYNTVTGPDWVLLPFLQALRESLSQSFRQYASIQ